MDTFNEIYPEVPVRGILKDAKDYVEGETINRAKFLEDIKSYAYNFGKSIPQALGVFFEANPQLSKKQKGSFALETSVSGNLIDGAVTLFHTLNITKENASSVLMEYIGVSLIDPQISAASWNIDRMMNWPIGTSLPDSHKHLEYLKRK